MSSAAVGQEHFQAEGTVCAKALGQKLLKEQQASETGRERGRKKVVGDKVGIPERVLGRRVV